MTTGGGLFTEDEVSYLWTLPAVKRVSERRIVYTQQFKEEVVRRYRLGESPSKIFREAGLDSSLIGFKRIERCIARWRDDPKVSAAIEKAQARNSIPRRVIAENGLVAAKGAGQADSEAGPYDAERSALGADLGALGNGDDASVGQSGDLARDAADAAGAPNAQGIRSGQSTQGVQDDQSAPEAGARNDGVLADSLTRVDLSRAHRPGRKPGSRSKDLRDLLIAQQIRYIHELEQTVNGLKAQLREALENTSSYHPA